MVNEMIGISDQETYSFFLIEGNSRSIIKDQGDMFQQVCVIQAGYLGGELWQTTQSCQRKNFKWKLENKEIARES